MLQTWQNEIKRLLTILLAVGVVGGLLGQLAPALLLALVIYCAYNLFQLRRMYRWLAQDPSSNKSAPPESIGLWGDIFDGIYRLQKQERKASAYLESIINKAQESSAALEMAVIVIDKQNNLDWWNRASEGMLGLKYPQDRNLAVTNLIRNPRFAEYFSTENYDDPLKINAPGDNSKVLEFQIALFGEHERLMIVRDVTQFHRLESMRKDFVGNVSHELGTPITVIKGYLEAIMDNIDSLDERWRKPMRQMHQQSNRMESIVRDLLLLSSLETRTLSKQQDKIPLAALLAEIKNDTQSIFDARSHEFIIDCSDEIVLRGARSELYSAISNLAVNAAKYTPENGVVVIKTHQSEDTINIEIIDNGIGIEAEHIPRLTERFYRVDSSRSSETGGTGLGLAIVKHILARHDGELKITSEVGQGSTFSCKLPIARLISKTTSAE
ncbi:MAG: two-component system phosphate regulon sensor histidine kinase PhoR [Pseudohongiellaceae bacterium]